MHSGFWKRNLPKLAFIVETFKDLSPLSGLDYEVHKAREKFTDPSLPVRIRERFLHFSTCLLPILGTNRTES